MDSNLILGLMSGTSFDGVDASFLYTDGINYKRTPFRMTRKYSSSTLKYLKIALNDPENFIICQNKMEKLSNLITIDHYKVAKKLIKKSALNPRYIGFHGQTILHKPDKRLSVQIGSGIKLSELLKKDVVFNFRLNDLQNGGQGAPIAPIYHLAIMRDLNFEFPICFLNIGGISNITFSDNLDLIGYDTGPGNNLIDAYVQKHTNLLFDKNGALAKKGNPNMSIITDFLKHPYFFKKHPKSLDRKTFINIINDKNLNKLKIEDAISTLSQITIKSIINEIRKLNVIPKNLVIMGGGQHNSYIVDELKSAFDFNVNISDDLGLPGDMIEAELIAYLTARNINSLPSTFKTTTGVKGPTIIGNFVKYY